MRERLIERVRVRVEWCRQQSPWSLINMENEENATVAISIMENESLATVAMVSDIRRMKASPRKGNSSPWFDI